MVKSQVQDTKKQNKGRVKQQHEQGNVYLFVDSPGYCWGSDTEGSSSILHIKLEVHCEVLK